jgi:hypothetical protein
MQSVSAAASFASGLPLNPMAARSSWSSAARQARGSSSLLCSKCDHQSRHLRARSTLRDRGLLCLLAVGASRRRSISRRPGPRQLDRFCFGTHSCGFSFRRTGVRRVRWDLHCRVAGVAVGGTEGQRPTLTDLFGAALAVMGALGDYRLRGTGALTLSMFRMLTEGIKLSLRLPLRRAQIACSSQRQPTRSIRKSLRQLDLPGNRRWLRGEFPINKPLYAAGRQSCR